MKRHIKDDDVPQKVALYCAFLFSILPEPKRKLLNDLLGISMQTLANVAMHRLNTTLAEYKKSIALGEVDENKIRSSLRAV